jgi:hypothetical protein
MDANLLRNVGITVGAAALAGALAVSQFAREPALDTVESVVPPAPVESTAQQTPAPEEPVFETAGAETPPPNAAPVSFLVRFQGSGPLGQAQALAESGRDAEARRAVEAALTRQSAFRGLCFDRFTVGGAEMVLRSCAPISAGEQAQRSADWLARLRAVSAVAYAEANASAQPAQPR